MMPPHFTHNIVHTPLLSMILTPSNIPLTIRVSFSSLYIKADGVIIQFYFEEELCF